MRLSELIEKAEQMQDKFGDIEVQAVRETVLLDPATGRSNSVFDFFTLVGLGYDKYGDDEPFIAEIEIEEDED